MELSGLRCKKMSQAGAGAADRSPRAGFTLLEVVIAMGILAFGLLGLASVQFQALAEGRQGRHVERASSIAQARMETLQRLDFDSPAMGPTGGWQVVRTVTEDVASASGVQTEMTYQVEERIEDDVLGFTKNVDVRVTWSEPNRPNRRMVVSSVRFDY